LRASPDCLVAPGCSAPSASRSTWRKRFETVVAAFGAAAAGGVFVPVNPLLKPAQVGYILRDCNVRVLVTRPTASRCSHRSWPGVPTCAS
jgi:acyl-CoA synthetase (AMP-forming)/AMP-acid ligase II